ncbi:hypothetical protein DRP77_10735 [Candidatus Poribacteria bacterium]|nr:MAG: hypothetical protein DRP77_10735 [Candidatus Poribacteria bacterium]
MVLFLILCREECCVCELEAITGWEQSRISHQLRLLRLSGLVESRREGKYVIYFVPERIKEDELFRAIYHRAELPSEIVDKIRFVKSLRMRESGETEASRGAMANG